MSELKVLIILFHLHKEILNILINDDGEVILGDSDPFIPFQSTSPIISGISKNSVYYKNNK